MKPKQYPEHESSKTAQPHSTKPELRFCAGSNPAGGMLEIRHGEDF